MSYDKQFHDRLRALDNVLVLPANSSNTAMNANQRRVMATLDADDAVTLTLPDVTEAKDKIYSIYANITTGGALTLQDNDESLDWGGDYTLDADTDAICLYSDGLKWWVLESLIA